MSETSIVVIGDELLSGFTLDTNTHWMADRLRLLGHALRRKTTIRDRPQEIVEAVRRDLDEPAIAILFVCGGIGPTPDDRTFGAVAEALERALVVWEPVRERIADRVRRMHEAGIFDSPELTEGNLRMARIPDRPDAVLRNRRGMAPGLMYEVAGTRLFILPGVPMEMKAIFTEEIEPHYLAGRSAATIRELRFLYAAESRFYPVLSEMEQAFPDVSVGSYPNTETRELVIRVAASDQGRADEVQAAIRARVAELGLQPT